VVVVVAVALQPVLAHGPVRGPHARHVPHTPRLQHVRAQLLAVVRRNQPRLHVGHVRQELVTTAIGVHAARHVALELKLVRAHVSIRMVRLHHSAHAQAPVHITPEHVIMDVQKRGRMVRGVAARRLVDQERKLAQRPVVTPMAP